MLSLVVPGSSEKMLAKAREARVDEVVIDLEDAVVPERKREALTAVVQALAAGGFTATRVSVRVNGLDTEWAAEELSALGGADVPPGAIIIPKATPAAITSADVALADAGNGVTRLHALIETAAAVAQVELIAGASTRLDALLIGYADLAVSLGRTPRGAADLGLWLAVQDRVLAAARAWNLAAIDGPYLGIRDEVGLQRSAQRAADLGFDGKWAIHPAQLDPIRAAFTPEAGEVEHARAVLAALNAAEHDGAGAVAFEGRMLDEPVRLAALRTLARAGEEVTA